jgi:hypothetical protein
MTKHLFSVLVLITGCTAAVETTSGDDVAGDDEGGGGGEGGGVANGFFKTTTMHDERFDTIDFATGEPVHTHAGPTIVLGGATCPDVFKHSYLMETPKFGREASANPIRFALSAKEYRVRRGEDVIADWSPVTDAALTISRAMLGDREGMYFVDARTGDKEQTACWSHHPLAAPVEVQPAQPDPTGLAGMKLTTNSPISRLLDPAADTRVFTQRFVHHTAEPVTITLDVTAPAATYARTAVEDYVVSSTGNAGVLCARDSDDYQNSDPICTLPNEMPVAQKSIRNGTLANATWSMQILDEATGAPAASCTIANLHATCQLAPRETTGAAQHYRIELAMRNAAELAPALTGPYAEHVIGAQDFTGKRLEVARRCAQFVQTTKFGVTIVSCSTFVEYTHIQALDTAQIMFGAMPITINGTSYNAAAYLWDAGDDDLPGPY